jgi:hypothetical protein
MALCATLMGMATVPAAPAVTTPDSGPVPRAVCGPGSNPETGAQGRVPAAEVESGRAQQGYTCNMAEVSHYGQHAGYKVFRYVDAAGHECAFYDSTLLFPKDALPAGPDLTGVYVLDMTDPAHPVKTANLLTPAMQSPHESLYLHAGRGLLMANMGSPLTNLGFVDIYDVSQDCRHPVLLHSSPLGILGHESGLSPDGNTYWVTSTAARTIVPLDITNPALPVPLWVGTDWSGHGLRVSEDGNRLYIADINDGLHILDVSEVQSRVPNPTVREISQLTWPEISIPQVAIPVSIGGHPYVIEMDEFSSNFSDFNKDDVGAARIIDIADETKPKVISNIRLEVHTPEAHVGEQKNDPGASSSLAGYAGHYCNVPRHDDPGILACSFILSGLRVFDIRDPYHPKEIAYFNKLVNPTMPGDLPSSYAMSSPTFVPERGEIWYLDGNSGFWALRVTNGVWPFTAARRASAPKPEPRVEAARTGNRGTLPATGASAPPLFAAALVFAAVGLRLYARRPA